MDPLRVDGLPVRAAVGLKELAARWDARASAATVVAPADPARASAQTPARRVAAASAKTQKGSAAEQTARRPRRGPREADERQELFPEVMGYGPNGWVIPLPEEGASLAGRGVDLDFYA